MKRIFKKTFFCLIFISGFLIWGNAKAAEHYIRAGASGTGTGLDWTNAMSEIPYNTWVRGDTYYIAGGTYVPQVNHSTYPVIYLLDTAGFQNPATISGTGTLTIKKATVSDHGTETGWESSYGTTQATLHNPTITSSYQTAVINIKASNIIIDGGELMGAVNNPASYGFLIKYPGDNTYGTTGALGDPNLSSAFRSGLNGVWTPNTSTTNFTLSNITLKGMAIIGPGAVPCIMREQGDGSTYTCYMNGIGSNSSNATNITVDSCYITDFPQAVSFVKASNITISNNYLTHDVGSGTGSHPETINLDTSNNVSFYNNIVYDSITFMIGIHNLDGAGGQMTGLKVYNNIFINNGRSLTGGISVMDGQTNVVYGAHINNNTFLNADFGGKGLFMVGNLTDVSTNKSYVYNNLIYNSGSPALDNSTYTAGGIVHDNNAYLACTGTISSADETAPQRDDSAANPFVDSANGDYSLKIGTLPINNGKTGLGATYAYDFAGNLRGNSPDIGAYEYVGADDTAPPASPTGLSVS